MDSTQAVIGMTDEEIDTWLEEACNDKSPLDPEAISAEYVRSLDVVVIKIDNGTRLVIQRELLEGLENATAEQLADIEIISGNIIGWTSLDVHHYLPRLLEGKYSSERWKQSRKPQPLAA